MLSWFVGLALVAGAFGQYKWDPSGQYRLVPDDKPILKTVWTPKFFENRLVSTPIELVEPWKTVVMDTLPMMEIEDMMKIKMSGDVSKEIKMSDDKTKKITMTDEKRKEIKASDILTRMMPEMKPKMEDMMIMEEERCMSMGECTMEIIERIKVKKPWMLDMLCENKGIGCMERLSDGKPKQLPALVAGNVFCDSTGWCRKLMTSELKEKERMMEQYKLWTR